MRRSRCGGWRAVALAAFLLIPCPAAHAWGCRAHRLIAAIAATRLTPTVAATVRALTDGASLASCAGTLAILAAWGAGTFLLALKWFRWQ